MKAAVFHNHIKYLTLYSAIYLCYNMISHPLLYYIILPRGFFQKNNCKPEKEVKLDTL